MEGVEGLRGAAISVIMLTYNREAFISRAVDSVLAQTLRSFEYIIVDNGSSDRSGVIADAYAAKDSRIRVIHREHGSIGSGRNAGLDMAEGEYITFIDDDDWCEPDYLEFLYNLAMGNNAEVSICGSANKAFNEKRIMSTEEALMELMWRKRYTMAFPTKMFSRKLTSYIHFPEGDRFDDISQMYRLLANSNCIAYHGLPKYTFYRHPGNTSAWTTAHGLLDSETLDEYLRVQHSRTEWLSERFPTRSAAWRYFEWSFMISMIEKIIRLEIKGCERQHMAMARELWINQDEFLQCEWIQDFEKIWVKEYVRYLSSLDMRKSGLISIYEG